MRDNILYYLYLLGKVSWIKSLYTMYYKLAIEVVRQYVGKSSYIKHAYLKGSFGQQYFVPVISDLDFFFIGEVSEDNLLKIEKSFKRIGLFFPMVSDFDFHTEKEADYLRNLSGVKFFETHSWLVLKGEEMGFSYRYHPRKFYVDVIHEIYFQLEWLFKNLKKRKNKEKFVTICIQRQYQKIHNLIKFLYNNDQLKLAFTPDEKWFGLSNETIIQNFLKLIWYDERIWRIHQVYKREYVSFNIEKTMLEPYYQNELEIIELEGEFQYQQKSHYFTKELFELFFYTGSIDSYLLFDWIERSEDQLSNYFLKAIYFTRLIEGRFNTRHDKSYFDENIKDAFHLKDIIHNHFRHFEFRTVNTFDHNIYVFTIWNRENVSWNLYESLLEQAHELPNNVSLLVFEVAQEKDYQHLSKLKHEKIEHVIITIYDYNEYVAFQNNLLVKMAAQWCFASRYLLMWNVGTKLLTSLQMIKLVPSLVKSNFIFPFEKTCHSSINEPAFCCVANWVHWCRLQRMTDIKIGNSSFKEFLKGLNMDFKVLNLKFQGEVFEKHEDLNERVALSLMNLDVSDFIDEIGFMKYELFDERIHQYKYFFDVIKSLAANDIIYQLSTLYQQKLLSFERSFQLKLNPNAETTIVAPNGHFAVIEENASHKFSIYTGGENTYAKYQLYYEFKLNTQFDEGLYLISITSIPESPFVDESLELVPRPGGNPNSYVEKIKHLTTVPSVFLVELGSLSEVIQFEGIVNLYSNRRYEFSISSNIIDVTSLQEEFFSSTKSLNLGPLPRGLYKLVIKFVESFSGDIYLNNNLGKRHQVANSDHFVLVLTVNEDNKDDLYLNDLKNNLAQIDIVKLIIPEVE